MRDGESVFISISACIRQSPQALTELGGADTAER